MVLMVFKLVNILSNTVLLSVSATSNLCVELQTKGLNLPTPYSTVRHKLPLSVLELKVFVPFGIYIQGKVDKDTAEVPLTEETATVPDTGCVAGKLDTATVPEQVALTLPDDTVTAGVPEMDTDPDIGCVAGKLETATVPVHVAFTVPDETVTAGVPEIDTLPDIGCVTGKLDTDTLPDTGCVAGKLATWTSSSSSSLIHSPKLVRSGDVIGIPAEYIFLNTCVTESLIILLLTL